MRIVKITLTNLFNFMANDIAKKILAFQKSVGAITKDSTNPFFHSRYFDINGLINEIKPELNKAGLVILQPLANLDGRPALKTILMDADTGEQIESATILPENADPQKMGSIITYFRRYALQSLLLLQAEDDDANAASERIIPAGTPANPLTGQPRDNGLAQKKCPICGNMHTGQYPKCLDCWKAGQKGATPTTKTIVNEDAPPFLG